MGKVQLVRRNAYQKNIFFLQELMNVPFEWRFIIYKFGPYSFDLFL